ncbi:MAG TPA: methyltransferase domain-containing protein [Actinomycetes bacterium]|jgi:SAM-dependent methyltransferase|nr:methyltransferase domain-containing protein [Actinomycetes bacterium]
MDEATMVKVQQFAERALAEAAASAGLALARVGDRLGLWQTMAGAGPLTPAELAERTGTAERYVREWLACQAAGGYVAYDRAAGTFTLPEEVAAVLAVEDSPVYGGGIVQSLAVLWKEEAALAEAFRSGAGIGWDQHDPDLYEAQERMGRPLLRDQLVASWIASLEGVAARLQQGASVAEVVCRSGTATILMAQAYPRSTFYGFDTHDVAVARARKAAAQAGVSDRATFEVASATAFSGRYDLVCFFNTLHDLGDPVGALAHARQALSDAGTVLVVEPRAPDRLEDNLTPLGRLFYAASTGWCLPSGMSEPPGLGLGNQVGEARLRELLAEAGFGHVRLAGDAPFHLVFEVRP